MDRALAGGLIPYPVDSIGLDCTTPPPLGRWPRSGRRWQRSRTSLGAAPASPAFSGPGIGECELVRLEGKPPTDVLVGEGRSGREVQVLYIEPGAKELYFFVNDKLDRIVKT